MKLFENIWLTCGLLGGVLCAAWKIAEIYGESETERGGRGVEWYLRQARIERCLRNIAAMFLLAFAVGAIVVVLVLIWR